MLINKNAKISDLSLHGFSCMWCFNVKLKNITEKTVNDLSSQQIKVGRFCRIMKVYCLIIEHVYKDDV